MSPSRTGTFPLCSCFADDIHYDGVNKRSNAYDSLSDVAFCYAGALMTSAGEGQTASEATCSVFSGFAEFLAAKAVAAPFKSGDIIIKEFPTSKGPLEMAAETVIDAKTLHLKDIAVYPKGAGNFELGAKEVLTMRNQLAAEAKALGFEKLRITGTRFSGAKPGKAPVQKLIPIYPR